jgi:hypothetical protein
MEVDPGDDDSIGGQSSPSQGISDTGNTWGRVPGTVDGSKGVTGVTASR